MGDKLLKGGTEMSTIKEISLLMPSSVLAIAMLFITVDFAVSVDPATRSSSAIVASSGEVVLSAEMPGRKIEYARPAPDALDGKIVKLTDR